MVERLSPKQAVTLVCMSCGHETVASADQCGAVDIEDPCPECNRCVLDWKYMEAERCKNCGKLDWHMAIAHRWCSRSCQLQGEYAESLRGAA
jgi:hypothetical protein